MQLIIFNFMEIFKISALEIFLLLLCMVEGMCFMVVDPSLPFLPTHVCCNTTNVLSKHGVEGEEFDPRHSQTRCVLARISKLVVFLSPPVLMHGRLVGTASHLSVCRVTTSLKSLNFRQVLEILEKSLNFNSNFGRFCRGNFVVTLDSVCLSVCHCTKSH